MTIGIFKHFTYLCSMKTINLNNYRHQKAHFDYKDKYIALTNNVLETQHAPKSFISESNIILLVEEGECCATINDQEYTLNKGDIIFCSPGNFIHKGMVSIDFRPCIFIISAEGSTEMLKGTHFSLSHYLSKNKVQSLHLKPEEVDIIVYYYKLIAAYGNKVNEFIQEQIIFRILQSLVYTFATFFVERGFTHNKPSGTSAEILFKRFVKMLQEHPHGRTVQYYAERLNISPKYFNSICKQISGKTASSIINEEIVNTALLLFKNHELSIKEISTMLGFTNQSHFGSFMRKQTGISPQILRKSNI